MFGFTKRKAPQYFGDFLLLNLDISALAVIN
jgi:hypothetical protein